MTETMKIPLDSYEDLLFVQERLAMYYIMLERSLRLSYGQHDIEWCQQFTAHQLSTNWEQAEDTIAQGIVHHFDGSEAEGRL